jgi:hypothetical protein
MYEVKSKPSPASGIRARSVSSAFATSLGGESIKPTMDKITGVQLAEKRQERTNLLTALAMLMLVLGFLGAIPFFMSREKVGEESPHYKTVPLATPFESIPSEPSISESTPAPINRWKQTPDTQLTPTPQPQHHASNE